MHAGGTAGGRGTGRRPGPGSISGGALALVEVYLAAPDAEVDAYAERYASYLGRPPAEQGEARVFALGGARLTLVAASAVDTVLPGEATPNPPAFAGYAVAVGDLAVTETLLRSDEVPYRRTTDGSLLVSAAWALGCAVVFRQHGNRRQ